MEKVSPDEWKESPSRIMLGALFPPLVLLAIVFHQRGGSSSESLTHARSFHFLSMFEAASESLYQTIHSPRTSRDPTLALIPQP